MAEVKITRRRFLNYAVTAVVCGVVAGVGGYLAGAASIVPETTTITRTEPPITRTVTTTETRTVTTTERVTTTVTAGVTPAPQTVTTTITTTVTQPPITQTVTKSVTVTPPILAHIPRELIEAAKKEGKVVFYNSLPVVVNEELKKRFEGLYGVELEWWRAGVDEIMTRYASEFDAGRYIMDVMRVPLPFAQGAVLLRKTELLSKVHVPGVEMLPAPYKDPDGYWVADVFIPFVMCYNTKLLKPEELPKKPSELADPKWRGKIAWADIATYPYAVVWMNTFEKQYGIDVVKGWAANKPILSGTSYLVPITKVATGEASITLPVPASLVMDAKAKGSPVDWVRPPGNAYPGELGSWMVSSKAPHPNAAKLFLSFIFAVDGGQYIMLNVGAYQPVWPGVKVEKPELFIQDLKIEYIVEPLWGDALKKKQDEYLKIFR
jgi:iron(III) transport system substrate-binding protein